jgi:7-cyano-7-deazaguanine synthase in queuosine biosynthesis
MKPLAFSAATEAAFFVDALEDGQASRHGALAAIIGRDLRLSITGLKSYFYADWQPVLVDLLVVAAAAEYCDVVAHRPAWGWARAFDVQVAVHDPARWNAPLAREALQDALGFLTGDNWTFNFVARVKPIEQVRQVLALGHPAKTIIPYSNGLDSLAVAALTDEAKPGELVRVRLGAALADQKSHNKKRQAFASVPYDVRVVKGRRKESSARSRGFKFAVITGIAAILAQADKIVVTESGQGALGPVLTVSGQAYPDYRVHPAFTVRVERLFATLLGRSAHYEFPRLWSTKGETIAEAARVGTQPWAETRSCWQQSRQVGMGGKQRQCGVCAACMLRRMSLHAAGVVEPADAYVWENLGARDFRSGAAPGFKLVTAALEQYAIAGVLHLDHLAALPDSPLHRRLIRRSAREVADALGESLEDTEMKLLSMLERHRDEWRNFLTWLGPDSFVTKLSSVVP